MEYIDLRKLNKGELKQVRNQVVRLKKLGKTGKEIEELTGVRQNCKGEYRKAINPFIIAIYAMTCA